MVTAATWFGLQYELLPKAWTFGFLPGFPAVVAGLAVPAAAARLAPAPRNKGPEECFRAFAEAAGEREAAPLTARAQRAGA